MQTGIKKYFIWLWMGALLLATTGVSIQQVYCYCLKKTTVSFTSAANAAATSTAAPLTSCCHLKSAHKSCCRMTATDGACKSKTTKVFQLKTEFVVEKQESRQPVFPFFALASPAWTDHLPVIPRFTCQTNKAPPILPLPCSGRDLCIRHQVFRC
jgi:hypothetical protein